MGLTTSLKFRVAFHTRPVRQDFNTDLDFEALVERLTLTPTLGQHELLRIMYEVPSQTSPGRVNEMCLGGAAFAVGATHEVTRERLKRFLGVLAATSCLTHAAASPLTQPTQAVLQLLGKAIVLNSEVLPKTLDALSSATPLACGQLMLQELLPLS